MEGTARIWFTSQQRAELWERWKNGQCVADIARALARRNKSGVYRILALNGGIAAWLFTKYGSWNIPVYWTAALTVVSAALILALRSMPLPGQKQEAQPELVTAKAG